MKSILLVILLLVGAAIAAPAEVESRVEYTTSLNSMAARVMNWYGSLISPKEPVSFSVTEPMWDDYRSRYPENIVQIKITSTDLIKDDQSPPNDYLYKFTVNSLITYKNSDDTYSLSMSEIFSFQVQPFTKPVVKNIFRKNEEKAKAAQTPEFARSHYKVREFSYTWLAYIDGIDVLESELDIDHAIYRMKIGGDEIEGSVFETLAARKRYLAKGGHLLRSLEIKAVENEVDIFVIDLILEWKGINQDGKPVLAKVHQEIKYQLQNNNSWKVLLIKEEHLLPDIAPWAGLLC